MPGPVGGLARWCGSAAATSPRAHLLAALRRGPAPRCTPAAAAAVRRALLSGGSGGAAAAPGGSSQRRLVALASVGAAALTVAPVAWYLHDVVYRPVPPYAQAVRGAWVATSEHDGSWALLKFNAFGMAKYQDSTGASCQGPVRYAPGALTIEPLASFLGTPVTLAVGSWPAAGGGDAGGSGGGGSDAGGDAGDLATWVVAGSTFHRA